ncbi:MAG: hypothetical protein ACE5H4_11340 [Candidatus Thorarchaeota archaeon]
MTENQAVPTGRYRDVAELRVQCFCEYRLHLSRKRGYKSSADSVLGIRLHQHVPLQSKQGQSVGEAIMVLVIIMTILAALLWVAG